MEASNNACSNCFDKVCYCLMTSIQFRTIEYGHPHSSNYRAVIHDDRGPISALHDVPLYTDDVHHTYNIVILSPKFSKAKMKINLDEPLTPIMHQENNGKPVFILNGYIWNYGVLPQCTIIPEQHGNDKPREKRKIKCVEVLEIGNRIAKIGDVIQVKIVGSFTLQGDKHPKMIAIDVRDPMVTIIHSLVSVIDHLPGLLKTTIEWFEAENEIPPEHRGQTPDMCDSNCIYGMIQELHQRYKGLTP